MLQTKSELLRARFSEPNLLQQIIRESVEVTKETGTIVLDQGVSVNFMPILISGALKVLRFDHTGKEILLYHVKAGETCAFTALALHSHRKSLVTAICEDTSTMILVPTHAHEYWFGKYDQWKHFIMATLEQRVCDLLNVVDHLAFHPLSDRLEALLHEKHRLHESDTLHTTHQALADELNTSREVVSRQLKLLEKAGRIALQRNHIRLVNL